MTLESWLLRGLPPLYLLVSGFFPRVSEGKLGGAWEQGYRSCTGDSSCVQIFPLHAEIHETEANLSILASCGCAVVHRKFVTQRKF